MRVNMFGFAMRVNMCWFGMRVRMRLFWLSSCECARAPRKQQAVTSVGAVRERERSQALCMNRIPIAKI
jgi:hypothetical protein